METLTAFQAWGKPRFAALLPYQERPIGQTGEHCTIGNTLLSRCLAAY